MERWRGILFGVLAAGFLAGPAWALDIQPTGDAQTLANAIVGKSGVVIKSVKYTGSAQASGTYTAGPLGLADGSIFTSGKATTALPPNNQTNAGDSWNLPGDPLCTALAGGIGTFDAARLEIVFTLPVGASGIRFDYAVGSEEYPEWVGEINDVAGIFVDGVNKALDKEGNAITINGPFFSGQSVITDSGTQYDGTTPRLQAQVAMDPGDHTMIIIVCDALDDILDTGIFVAGLGVCLGNCDSVAWCGDGKKDPGEDCDDGNNKDGDGCDNTCKLEAVCGDGLCFVDESCETCPADCGECAPVCGDQKCNGAETCKTCAADCGECPPECGDGSCNGAETCKTCAADCGDCPPECGDGSCNGAETCKTCAADCGDCPPECGDGMCNGAETCKTCAADCGECPPECGDGSCNGAEDSCSCPGDCPDDPESCSACECGGSGGNCYCDVACIELGDCCENACEVCDSCTPDCGDGECNGEETCETCEDDCGACPPDCGDGVCADDETCESCWQDCGECPDSCGDGECNGEEEAETCASCPQDCGECPPPACGDKLCNGDETCTSCPEDCPKCPPAQCGDSTCNEGETCESCEADCGECATCGDGECNGEETCKDCEQDCGKCAPPECGDNLCNGEENCETCPDDCGTCPDGYGSCESCPESCEAEPDYSGVTVSGGPGGCSAAPGGTSTSASGALLLMAGAALALLIVRRRNVRAGAAFLSAVLVTLFLATPVSALEITTTDDAQVLSKALLSGGGIEIKSATFTGHAEAAGSYTAGPLGIGDGSILTSGSAQIALPPNDESGAGSSWGLAGDPLCDQLVGDVATGDAARLEIVFTVKEGFDGIKFDYVVGSEEYPEYVGEFNDAVGIFLDGVNKALDADGNAITINGPFFSGSEVVTDSGTEYDGTTPRLQQQVKLSAGEHTLIVVVCDALDTSLDTGVFVSALSGCKGNCDTTAWCGDGKVDEGEDCDDGNNVDGDGCDNTCKLEAVCGDGKCYVDESCDGCPADCGECAPECGDTICNGDETCESCADDCGACPPECGDGECNGDETCESCAADCGECPDPCGDGTCADDETCESCAADCGECPDPCGDGTCDEGETCESCAADCGECPLPEPCGDGVCGEDENCLSCDKDCGKCPPKCEDCDPACEEEDGDVEVSGGVTSCTASPLTGSSAPVAGLVLLGGLALAVLFARRRFFRSGLLLALIVAAAAVTMAPATARAQQDVQIESQFFKPSPFVHDYFTVGTGDVMGECYWNVGLMLNYQNDPLVLRTTGGSELGSLVEHQVTGDVLAAIKVLDWLGVGLDVPVILLQQGEDITGFPSAGVAGVGDIRLVPRARLYQTEDGFFNLGAELIVTFPTGKLIDPYMGRNGFGILPRLLASLDFGRGGLALNAGALVATGKDKALNVDTGHAIDTRLGGWVGLVPDQVDLVAELGTQMKLTEPMKNMENNPVEALGGIKWHVIPGLDVSAGGGAGVTEGAAAPDFRVFAGVMYSSCCKAEPPPKPFCDADPDGDKLCSPCVFEQDREEEFASVCKGADKCPAEPEDFDNFEDSEGCPDPDNDKDGICDPWVAEKGLADKYKDLCKLSDKCPDVPEDADGFEDDDGCPDPDNDKDKICDPWVEEKGLGDKYKDVCKPNDKCPNEPETVNSYQDDDGCPDKAVVIEKKKIIILQKVEFYFDETRIKEESFPLLDEVVQTLKDNPQIKKVRVEGHTDERGEEKYNMKLSSGRVETVMKYLVEHGIDAKRLTFKGYGESKPLAKNAQTEEDHQRNRRVEFIILELEE